MVQRRKVWAALGFLGLMSLAACVDTAPIVEPTPQARPQPRVAPPVVTVTPPSAESEQLAVYYRRLQNDMLVQGLLRGDGGGPDTPFTDTVLARNFVRIALFDEFRVDNDTLRSQTTISALRRWEVPVRMSVSFGNSVPAAERATDRAAVSSYAARLSRVTGHPITLTDTNPNYHVIFAGHDDKDATADRIRRIVPDISRSVLNAVINPPRDQLCVVVAFSEGDKSSYFRAIAVIRSEHPRLLRTSCIHEEIAQGMGLANDSPRARPSIFNDDDEFGRLTTHDEFLLRILYDRRLRSGMTLSEAAPVARVIARELLDSGPS